MTRFSALSLFAKALGNHKDWPEQWPDAAPKPGYDAIIIGGGGHGLGAAYYLAKKYGKKAGLAAATPGATQRSSAPTISMMKARIFMIMRSSYGMS
jgi:alkyl hydroperoxide reductase subunit AhpF